MAFTDEQFDARLISPMFRSMRPASRPRSALNGLLSAPVSPAAPELTQGTAAPNYEMPNPASTSPSRAQLLSRPARTEYAKTPPPAQQPQQVWRSPSTGIARTLLDDANASVVSGIPDAWDARQRPPAPPTQPAQAIQPYPNVDSPLPPEAEVLIPQGGALPAPAPDYLNPIQYAPLQPSRRYEVI